MIRTACFIMRLPNEKIVELMAECAADGTSNQMINTFDDSMKFFANMQDLLAGASSWLLLRATLAGNAQPEHDDGC
jgi:hypothetical protein